MTQITVTGRFTHPNQSPASGYVEFTPRPSRIILPGGSGPVELGAVQAPLDSAGRFTISLQASDDPTIDPFGWTYEVREAVSGGVGRTYDIEVPIATVGSLDLATVMPVESASGSVTLTPGPQGPQGIQGIQGATGATGPAGPHDGTQNDYGYNTVAGMGVVSSRIGWSAVASPSLVGTLWLAFFTAGLSKPANRWDMANGVAAGALTLCRGGLYTVDGSNNLALSAASPNDTTLLAGTNAKFGKAFSSPLALTAGQRYAFGFLFTGTVGSLTMLQLSPGAISHFSYDSAPRVSGSLGAQSDLPASIAAGSVAASNILLWGELS